MWILASQHSLSFLSTLVLSLFLEEFLPLCLFLFLSTCVFIKPLQTKTGSLKGPEGS